MTTFDNSINGALDGLSTQRLTGPATNKLGQEQFLELMIAQLKNQDPLKPMENGEFLGQIAQFGTVSGIQDLQKSFGQLAGALQSNQALMASSLVGRSVLTPGNVGALTAGGALSGTVELNSSAANLAISIVDGNGQLVRRLELGTQAAGSVPFSWDGLTDAGSPAVPGRYQVRAEAVVNGQATAMATQIAARVDSVTLGGAQGIVLNLAGLGAVAFNDVKQIS